MKQILREKKDTRSNDRGGFIVVLVGATILLILATLLLPLRKENLLPAPTFQPSQSVTGSTLQPAIPD